METLADRIARDGPINELDAVGWAIRLAKRLEALHALGVAHGAVSPACILTAGADRSSRACLADVQRTSSSLAYQSPERLLGGDISPADDTWALAATLYTALTGAGPFFAATEPEVRQKILAAAPAPLSVYDVGDDDLQHILEAALARDLARRTSSATALRRALEEWHPDPGVASLPALADEGDAEEDEDDGGATVMRAAPVYMPKPIPRIHDDDEDDDVRTVAREFATPGSPAVAAFAPSPAAGRAPIAAPRPAAGRAVDAAPAPLAPAAASGAIPKINEDDEEDDDVRTVMRTSAEIANEDSSDVRTVARELAYNPPAAAPPAGEAGPTKVEIRRPDVPLPAWDGPNPAATLALEGFELPQIPGAPPAAAPAPTGSLLGPSPAAAAPAPVPAPLAASAPSPYAAPAAPAPQPVTPAKSSRGVMIAAVLALLVAAAVTFVLLRYKLLAQG